MVQRGNVVRAMQEIEQRVCQCMTRVLCLTIDLLIVGPLKPLRMDCAKQTANAFLKITRTLKLLRISNTQVVVFATKKT
jgi:hypothetical protein